jgi:hypothetical protein
MNLILSSQKFLNNLSEVSEDNDGEADFMEKVMHKSNRVKQIPALNP